MKQSSASALIRRPLELRLLLIVFALTLLGMVLAQAGVSWSAHGEVRLAPGRWLLWTVAYGAGLLALNRLLSWRAPAADQILLPVVGLLGGLSLILIARLAPSLLDRQGLWLILGQLVLLWAAGSGRLPAWLGRYPYLIALGGLVLLLATAFWGQAANPELPQGPRVQLALGPLHFQPAELIKLCLVIFLAAYLSRVGGRMHHYVYWIGRLKLPAPAYLLPSLVMLALALVALFWMKDLGAMILLLLIFVGMLYAALERSLFWALALAGLLALLLVASLIYLGVQAEWLSLPAVVTQRVQVWLDPWSEAPAYCAQTRSMEPVYRCLGYQTLQSLYAVSAGGLTGTGLGLGSPRHVPAVYTDLIFAAVAEEMGAMGGLVLLLLYTTLLLRGLAIAGRQADHFRSLLAAGLVAALGAQLLVIIGGTLNLFPLTGITVPFLSYGGTAVLMNFLMVGLWLNLSCHQVAGAPIGLSLRPNLRRLASPIVAGFSLLGLWLAYWQIWQAPRLNPTFFDLVPAQAASAPLAPVGPDGRLVALPGRENGEAAAGPAQPEAAARPLTPAEAQRVRQAIRQIARGAILDRDGAPLAVSRRQEDGSWVRSYPEPSLAPVIGMTTDLEGGVSGLEWAYNAALLGAGRSDPTTLYHQLLGGELQGNDLQLTIDLDLQREAEALLGDHQGAVVVLEAHSGAVLAMVSHPSFDPNLPLTEERRAELAAAGEAVMLNRATQGLYPPGSTFKTVTAAAMLEYGLADLDSSYSYPDLVWAGAPLPCHYLTVNGYTFYSCNHSQAALDFAGVYAWSDNITFAQFGLALGELKLARLTRALGFEEAPPLEIPTVASRLTAGEPGLADPVTLAATAFGQGELQVTPLQMALVAATIANGGEVPTPHLTQAILSPSGRVLQSEPPPAWRVALRPETAAAMRQVMIASVETGWAGPAAVPGCTVGGKTGTAERAALNAEGRAVPLPPHAWYIGFAERDSRTIALAVLVEEGGEGSQTAAPLAALLAEAALGQ